MKKTLILLCFIFISFNGSAQDKKPLTGLVFKFVPIYSNIPFADFYRGFVYNFELERIDKKQNHSTVFGFGYRELQKKEVIARGGLLGETDVEFMNIRLGKRFYSQKQKRTLAGFYIFPEARFYRNWGYKEDVTRSDNYFEMNFDLKSYHLYCNLGYQNRLFKHLNFDFSIGPGFDYTLIDYDIEYNLGRTSGLVAQDYFFVYKKFSSYEETQSNIKSFTLSFYLLGSIGWAF